MSAVQEMVNKIDRLGGRLDAMEKSVAVMSRPSEREDWVRKSLSSAPGNHKGHGATIGFDGADQLGLIKFSGCRNKSLGWGEFLTVCAAGGQGKDPVQVEKAMEKWRSRPVQKTALAEGSGATGGYTVPVQFYADLMRLVAEASFVRGRCTTVPMQSRTLLVPALDQGQTPGTYTSAFFGGIAASWQPEAATINESEPSFRQIELVARDLVFYTVASNQLLQDNAVSLDTLLTTLFQEAMAWFVDYFVLRGNGAGQPLGVLNAPGTYSASRAGNTNHFSLANAANMISHLLMSCWSNAIWVMHPSVLPELITMTNGATNSGFLVWLNAAPDGMEGPAATTLPARFFGIPIYWSEKVPALGTAGDINLIDFSKVLVGDRLAIQIETSKEAKFLQNQMVWRIIMRWDSQPWLNLPVTLNDGSWMVSPFVSLAA